MPTINLSDPINDTRTDASLIAANNQLIEALLNGGLDNNNILPAAGIEASKIKNYPNDVKKALLGDGTWGFPQGAGDVWRFPAKTLSNFSVLTDLISQDIAAGTLAANKKLRVFLVGDLLANGTTTATGLQWQISYGGVIYYFSQTNTLAQDADRCAWILNFELANIDQTHQYLSGRLTFGSRQNASQGFTGGKGFSSLGASDVEGGTFASNPADPATGADSNALQTLKVSFKHTVPHVNNDIRMQHGMMELVG